MGKLQYSKRGCASYASFARAFSGDSTLFPLPCGGGQGVGCHVGAKPKHLVIARGASLVAIKRLGRSIRLIASLTLAMTHENVCLSNGTKIACILMYLKKEKHEG